MVKKKPATSNENILKEMAEVKAEINNSKELDSLKKQNRQKTSGASGEFKQLDNKKSIQKKINASESDNMPEQIENNGSVIPHTVFSDSDIQLFQQGEHFRIYEKMGAHSLKLKQKEGIHFAVWAPNAKVVSVIGAFNAWDKNANKLFARWDGSGIWEGFIPGLMQGEVYKYSIENYDGVCLDKGDPYAFYWELRPATGSITWDITYAWNDKNWMKKRKTINALNKPCSIYEVHLGSWKRNPDDAEKFLTYRELADLLPQYCSELGFTHVELMPVMEYPYDGSWGYQQTGYYAATARYGTPQDLMFLIDEFHNHDLGVILDWVPSHFPYDMQGLHLFDGTHLYEHGDMRKGYHPDWKSYIFDSGRKEVRSFLLSNAIFWLDKYHADGLRVDAVASMLQLDYSRNEGDWLPNEFGGNENLDNVSLFKSLNNQIQKEFPDVQIIAEESSTWPGVTHAVKEGGLGFGMKWMMGWMNDTLTYFKREPIYRKWHQNDITFSLVYAFSENFLLPLSHDEVVHGKASMILKMPGDEWHRYANLRVLYTYMWAHPGAKLLFMGNEFAQTNEWNFAASLDWNLLEFEPHLGMQKLIADLNKVYKTEPALYEYSFHPKGFEWIAGDDTENSILVFLRKGKKEKDTLIVVLNLNVMHMVNYRIGVPKEGTYKEIFNSDSKIYWGNNESNKNIKSEKIKKHGKLNSMEISIPPLSGLIFKLT